MSVATRDTIEGLDVDEFVRLLADEPDVPCTSIDCENAARWASLCGWCATTTPLCDECRTNVDLWQAHGHEIRCAVMRGAHMCGWLHPSPMPWRTL